MPLPALVGKQAVVVGAGMGGLRPRARSPITSSAWSCWSATPCRETPPTGRGPAGPTRPRPAGRRPARTRRSVSRLRAGPGRGGRGAAPGWARHSHRAPGLRSLSPGANSAGSLLHVAATGRADRATRRGATCQHPAAPALPGPDVVATSDRAAVTAVRCENADGGRETLPADLVVDASGRGALTLAALESIGRPLPEETTIGVDVGYATAVFAIPDDAPPDWKGVTRSAGPSPGRATPCARRPTPR